MFIEILQFIFQSFWHFIGFLIITNSLLGHLINLFAVIRGLQPTDNQVFKLNIKNNKQK